MQGTSAPLLYAVETCPACGAPSASARSLFDAPFLGVTTAVLSCRECTLCYKSLAPTEAGIARIYGEGYDHFQDAGALELGELYSARQKLRAVGRLLGDPRPPSALRVLDVGCGHGRFVALLRRLGYRADGIDPFVPPEMAGPHVRRGRPEDVPAESYDVALMLNVVEHLTDPHPLFVAVRRLLRPGGVLLLTCPYGASLARRLHRERWIHLALDEHLLFWTPRALGVALRAAGFDGASTYRVAGSPFPFGRTAPPTPLVTATPAGEAPSTPAASRPALSQRVQGRVWGFARSLMRREAAANAVRRAVHLTRTGDYLELAIARR